MAKGGDYHYPPSPATFRKAAEAAALAVRSPDGRFAPGNPGRRIGTRNRISRRVILTVLADFEAHKEHILTGLRLTRYLPAYARLLTALLPRNLDIEDTELTECTDAEIAQLIEETRAMLDMIESGEASRFELESILNPTVSTVINGESAQRPKTRRQSRRPLRSVAQRDSPPCLLPQPDAE